MRWFKLTVETFESTTNPPNGSFVVMTRKEGPAGGRSGGGVYEMAPESAALISLRYGGREGGSFSFPIIIYFPGLFIYNWYRSIFLTQTIPSLFPSTPQLRFGAGGRLTQHPLQL